MDTNFLDQVKGRGAMTDMKQSPISTGSRVRHFSSLCALMVLALIVYGCGGGGGTGGGSQNPPPPTPDFELALNPASISVLSGGSVSTSLSATPLNGFSSQISVQVTGLPSGVSVTPSTITLVPGTPQNLTFSATSSANSSSNTAVLTGTSGSLSHSASLGVAVQGPSSKITSLRTKYLRTDAVTEYLLWLNTHWTYFHQSTSRFFVTDPVGNQVLVLDSVSQTMIASIPVPGAYGIDDTPDHGTLYVGTTIGDVYTIDPVAMTVTHRYIASEIGPYGFQALSAQVLSNGSVALLGVAGGIPSVDGSPSFAVWSPTDNSITIYATQYGVGQLSPLIPAKVVCGNLMGNIGGFTRTADRKAVVIGSIDSDGTLCEINASTGHDIHVQAAGSTYTIVASPDNSVIALSGPQGVFYEPHTLNKVAQFDINAVFFSFSADSKTLFATSDSVVYAYDVATHQQVGWMSNLVIEPTSGGLAMGTISGPNLGAVDGTGVLGGPMEEGFGFIDSKAMHTGPVGTQFVNAFVTPETGPVGGGTLTEWEAPAALNAQSQIFFGGYAAQNISNSGALVMATTPPETAGAVDVYGFVPDGGMQIIPDGFSYGPTILEVTPDTATADGGATGFIYGYGFGVLDGTTIPGDLKVSVNGKTATLLGFNGDAYNIIGQPFPLESIAFTIPAGTAGPADITVTTTSGSATAMGTLTYLPSVPQFPLSGSTLVQGIYDPIRDVYYFTDANKIQVFSLTQGKWLSPITIPPPAGATQRLWGISLSPDGSKLAVADAKAGVIYVLDPSNTSSVQTFPYTPPAVPAGTIASPYGLAIANSGPAYITGDGGFLSLDLNTGVLTSLGPNGLVGFGGGQYTKTAISSDGARAYFNADGVPFSVDTATNAVFLASTDPGCCYGDYDLTLSRNQTQFEATGYLYDSNLNAESFLTLNDRENQNISYVYGTKLSPDGSLFFQPSTNGVDIFDGHQGTLRNRLALPFPLSQNYDALVGDGKDNVLIAITGPSGNGIAVLDLTSFSEPPPSSYESALMAHRTGSESQNPGSVNDVAANVRSTVTSNPGTFRSRVIPHVTNAKLMPLNKLR